MIDSNFSHFTIGNRTLALKFEFNFNKSFVQLSHNVPINACDKNVYLFRVYSTLSTKD